MFREMRRFKQQLEKQECIDILQSEVRAVLSVLGDNDYPYGLPINFWYNPDDNKIYFHGAKEGHKIDSIKKHDKVSLCVYDKGYKKEGEWSLNIKSVIVFGRIKIVKDMQKTIDICKNLARRFPADTQYIEDEINKFKDRVLCLELTIEHMSGKLVNES